MNYLQKELYDLVKKESNIFDFIQESALDGLWYWDLEKMEEEWMNSKFWTTLGYDPKLMPHKSNAWQHIINQEDLQSAFAKVQLHLANPGSTYDQIVRYTHKKGHTVWIRCRGMAIRDEEGKALRMLGAHTDVTELKQREEELKKILDITMDQNVRLKNFAYIVSHNLRSHASNIEMLSNILLDEDDSTEENENLKLLKQSSKNLTETISHLHEIVSINVSTSDLIEEIDLSEAIDVAVSNHSIDAKNSNVNIINETSNDLKVNGVKAYVESILFNFISNGIKYNSPERDSFLKITDGQNDDYLTLSFEDNGLGIDLEKYRSKLFGMYKTFHGNKDSKGIGLFITKNQVEAMGGKIEVESKVDSGTHFKIYLKK